MTDHSAKIAVVTGAAQGIGKACAERLYADGATVVLSDIKQDELSQTVKALDPSGERAFAMICDVGCREAIVELLKKVKDQFGRLDIMVNNAAISCSTSALELTEDELDSVLNVNLKGTFWGTQEAAKIMVEQEGGGAIVNMSSSQAVLAIPDRVPYGISKAGVNQLTRIFAIALATKGVRVNAVGPGTILTPLTIGLKDKEDAYRRILSRTPMGRLGHASEVASVASFLASDDASYITGQTIYPDGGRANLSYTVPVPDDLPELKLP
ncbi:MAG: SDR family NAD(P)-dependent oxidoreductase [Alphaproteobacteria bacterium]